MAFVFDLDDEFRQELPTTIIRSKDDCPKEGVSVTSRVDPVLLEKVSKVMSLVRQGSKGYKKKKKTIKEEVVPTPTPEKEKVPPKPEPVVEEEEDELFPNVGEYVLQVPDKHKKEDKAQKEEKTDGKQKKYFEKQDKEDAEAAPVAPKFSTKAALLQAQAFAQLNKLSGLEAADTEKAKEKEKETPKTAEPTKKRTVDEREKDPGFVSETYSECYPGSFETAMYAYESDEEEDLTKMDMGTKKNKLKRWDFDDEESWNAYNDQREATPKAAFQFGVKMADGRKTRRTPKNKDQKLDADLNKINQILKKRAEDTVAARKGKGGGGAADLIADLAPEEDDGAAAYRGRRKNIQVDDDRAAKRRHRDD
jgi:IK cytokine